MDKLKTLFIYMILTLKSQAHEAFNKNPTPKLINKFRNRNIVLNVFY